MQIFFSHWKSETCHLLTKTSEVWICQVCPNAPGCGRRSWRRYKRTNLIWFYNKKSAKLEEVSLVWRIMVITAPEICKKGSFRRKGELANPGEELNYFRIIQSKWQRVGSETKNTSLVAAVVRWGKENGATLEILWTWPIIVIIIIFGSSSSSTTLSSS